jgi:hypothetical protein
MNLFCSGCGCFRSLTYNGKQDAPGTRFNGMEYWTCDRCHTTQTTRQRQAIKAYAETERMKREADWHHKARQCSNPYTLALALVLGGLAMAIVFSV